MNLMNTVTVIYHWIGRAVEIELPLDATARDIYSRYRRATRRRPQSFVLMYAGGPIRCNDRARAYCNNWNREINLQVVEMPPRVEERRGGMEETDEASEMENPMDNDAPLPEVMAAREVNEEASEEEN